MNRSYKLIAFDWNGTLSMSDQAQLHYKDSKAVPMLFPGVKSTLAELKSMGYVLAIVSSASSARLNFEAAHYEIDRYISFIMGCDQGLYKPDPGIIDQLALMSGVEASHMLMVGDSAQDMLLANNAKIDAIGISTGLLSEVELRQYTPVQIIHRISELVDILRK